MWLHKDKKKNSYNGKQKCYSMETKTSSGRPQAATRSSTSSLTTANTCHSIFFPSQFHEQIAKLIDFLSSSHTFFSTSKATCLHPIGLKIDRCQHSFYSIVVNSSFPPKKRQHIIYRVCSSYNNPFIVVFAWFASQPASSTILSY